MDKMREPKRKSSQSDNKYKKAFKDCRVCKRRRIKCDRAVPSCKKCVSRDLTCPGYGVILNWDWGVASRGKLAGKMIPAIQQVNSSGGQPKEKPLCPSPDTSDEVQLTSSDLPLLINPSTIDARSQCHVGSSSDYVRPPPYRPSADNCLVAVPSFRIGILQDQTARRLFHHYGQTLAAAMAWMDTPENQWRTTMMSLALRSTPLLLSMLAFAAEHLCSVTISSCSSLKEDLTRRAHCYRDSALILLASDMRSQTLIPETSRSMEEGVSRHDLVNSVLASMLMLCNMETIRPDSRLWRLHLQAARTVASTQTTTGTFFKHEDSKFLAEQLFVFDTFACTTSFGDIYDQELLTEDNRSVFIEFLRLIKWVTSLERQTAARKLSEPGIYPTSAELCRLFEQAKDLTLALCSQTIFNTQAEREQFLGVVDSFHHAGLLYSYRCLSLPDLEEKIMQSRSALFQSLNLVQLDRHAFVQNIFWPLFIAGTEAQSHDGTSTVVEQKLKQAMRRTGFSNCEVALQFLRTLWIARDGGHYLTFRRNYTWEAKIGTEISWIQVARHWTSCGKQFLVY